VALLDCDDVVDGVLVLKLETEGRVVTAEVEINDNKVKTDGSEVTTELWTEENELDTDGSDVTSEVLTDGSELEIDESELTTEVLTEGPEVEADGREVTEEVLTVNVVENDGSEVIGVVLIEDRTLELDEDGLATELVRDWLLLVVDVCAWLVEAGAFVGETGLAGKVGVVQTLKISQSNLDVVHEVYAAGCPQDVTVANPKGALSWKQFAVTYGPAEGACVQVEEYVVAGAK
jgi:hypothetical protein